MKARWIAALVCLAVVNTPGRVLGQARASGRSRPHGPDAGSSRPPSPSGPRGRPSTPSSPSTHPRFTSPMLFAPLPEPLAGRHRPFPFRSSRFGFVFVDPFWPWTPGDVEQTFVAQAVPPSGESLPAGGLQLDVEPRRAEVYADGQYVGLVDDCSGYYHHLEIGAGSHIIDMVAAGYEPLTIRVTVSPGRTTTYRGSLNRAPSSH